MLQHVRLCRNSLVLQTSPRLLRQPMSWILQSTWSYRFGSYDITLDRERKVGVRPGRVLSSSTCGRAPVPTGEGQILGGSIHVIIGPMFSGKTSQLLRKTQELEEQGVTDILLLKSEKDSRYSSDHVVSHDGILRKCFAVHHLCRDVIDSGHLKDLYNSSRVVAIDEAQFFERDLIEFCTRAADDDKKHVIIAGLDGDFTRSRFGYVLDMIPLADTVTKLTGTCHLCEEKALFSKRIGGDSDKQEVIGGAERYIPVCRRHYLDE